MERGRGEHSDGVEGINLAKPGFNEFNRAMITTSSEIPRTFPGQ